MNDSYWVWNYLRSFCYTTFQNQFITNLDVFLAIRLPGNPNKSKTCSKKKKKTSSLKNELLVIKYLST